jgi:hypothetical protein
MPSEHPGQALVLIPQRPMPHMATLLGERLEGTRKPILGRYLAHHCLTLSRAAPHVGKAQEIEARRQRWSFARVSVRSPIPEVDQTSLVRMQLQPVLAKALLQHFQNSSASSLWANSPSSSTPAL